MLSIRYSSCMRRLASSLLPVLFIMAACSSSPTIVTPNSSLVAKLPGDQIWKQGVSSFLFGTNDTQEWSANNVETSSAIQGALKAAHFTLMRTFFFDKSLADGHATTDAEIEQRLQTIERSGMFCLGVLSDIFNVSFDEHVVKYAGNRCLMYEFGNEPSFNGISSANYLKQWNTVIPQLRKLNPRAKFIGPVDGVNNFLQAFISGVKSSGVLPDAISFHWYPCYYNTRADCLSKASSVIEEVQQVQAWERSILGKVLPVGITEWNYDPSNPPPSYGDESDFMTQFSTTALRSMIQAGVAFACQFDAASYSGYGRLDMFDVTTNNPKPQYYAMKSLIAQYRP
jgi:hypothetical protein